MFETALARRTGRALLLGLTTVALAACSRIESQGEFGDEGTDEGEALPPDLLQSECDPRQSNECEPGQKCGYVVDPEHGPTNRCVELLGEGVDGDPCQKIGDSDDCANEYICWATDAEGLDGVCVHFCNPALLCDLPGQICSVSNGATLPLCLPRCNPLIQDCEPGWGCYADPGGRWACDRDQSGPSGAHGDACACLNCCDPGLICRSGARVEAEGCGEGGAAGCCAELCQVQDPPPLEPQCPTELESCEPFYEPDATMADLEDVGVCER